MPIHPTKSKKPLSTLQKPPSKPPSGNTKTGFNPRRPLLLRDPPPWRRELATRRISSEFRELVPEFELQDFAESFDFEVDLEKSNSVKGS
ncbi:hypothetical protein AAC387_Pa07g1781 [Persea americana]